MEDSGDNMAGGRDAARAERRIWLLTAFNVAAGLAVFYRFVLPQGPVDEAPLHLQWWFLAALFALTEMFAVHLQFRREAYSLSLSEIPLVLGLFFSSPPELLLAYLVGATGALMVYRKQRSTKLLFNVSKACIEIPVALLVFHSILRLGEPIGPAGWGATFAATTVADAVAGIMMFIAISLHEGRSQALSRTFGIGTVATFMNTTLALAGVAIMWSYPAGLWMVFVLAFCLYGAYAAHSKVSQKHQAIEDLYRSTRMAPGAVKLEATIESLLARAREMCRAEVAEVILFPPEGEDGALRATLSRGERCEMQNPAALDPTQGVWARVASEDQALLVAHPVTNERLKRHFAARGLRDAMVAPLRGDTRIIGTILVGNRMGNVRTFDVGDLKVFETLANHASVSIENARLVDRLQTEAAAKEYQALHDSLTGLPNRSLFHDRVGQATREAERQDQGLAVMLMDLDRFKEVNDTLGHHNGDLMLQEVGKRLTGVLRDSDSVARLGGDEFALLLPGVSDDDSAMTMASKILAAVNRPLPLREITLDVGASLGIAMFPDHGRDADTLIQHADVAMYLAKETHSGSEIYEQKRNRYSTDRLALISDLRWAIETRSMDVHYQPKIDVSSGKVSGVEALVRWEHPRYGMMSPADFIPIAEHTGLIRPLSLLVLDLAVEQCRRWRTEGKELTVAVNLSARNLMDLDLPGDIKRLLDRWKLPAGSLVVEVTESALMTDPGRTHAVLAELSDMGVGVSIDDFGTGYSSLMHLKRLPVDEVKVDRSFVMGMMTEEGDAVMVRSIVELAHNLGLRVVAEGVEDERALNRLGGFGCDVAQGFHFARPMAARDLTSWMEQRGSHRAPAAGTDQTPMVAPAV